jgi:hypothetical protein
MTSDCETVFAGQSLTFNKYDGLFALPDKCLPPFLFQILSPFERISIFTFMLAMLGWKT